MVEENLCEYLLEHKDNDKYIFYLRGEKGILFCANPKCPYDNHFGKPFSLEGEGNYVRACKTSGLKKADVDEKEFEKKLEKVVEDSGIVMVSLKKPEIEDCV